MSNTHQVVGNRSILINVEGDGNKISTGPEVIDIPELLPFRPNRKPQLKQLQHALDNMQDDQPSLIVVECDSDDSPDFFIRRVVEEILCHAHDSNASHFSPTFNCTNKSSKETFFENWSSSLETRLIGPKHNHPTVSIDKRWDNILDHFKQINSNAILISSVIETEDVDNIPASSWDYWRTSIAERFCRDNIHMNIIILVTICSEPSFWSFLLNRKSKNLNALLLQQNNLLPAIELSKLSKVSKHDVRDWSDEYFFDWYKDQVESERKSSTAADATSALKENVRKLFRRKNAIAMDLLATTLRENIDSIVNRGLK